MSDQETATVLAALRLWQEQTRGTSIIAGAAHDHETAYPASSADFFIDHLPLTSAEIDALCDRLERGDV